MRCLKTSAEALLILTCLLLPTHTIADIGPTTHRLPVVAGTPETRSTPFIAWYEDLAPKGYVEQEYLQSGTANVYRYTDDKKDTSDIETAIPAEPYQTRLLVRKPTSAKKFNGTVYVEILNPTAGWDGDPMWQNTHDYLIREGAAWVGITSKPITVKFLRDRWGEPPDFAKRNRSRYQSLSMPYFGQVWDVITDTLTLLKSEDSQMNPLENLEVQRVILVGYSQSVDFQTTYANHFHNDALVSGYFLAAGGESAKRINRLDGAEELASGDARNKVMVAAPVVRFQTQTEVVGFGAYRVRQHEPEYPNIRLYEMAGGAHVDVLTGQLGAKSIARDLQLPSFDNSCELTINPVRIGVVQSALLEVLNQWIDGKTPPMSKMIALDEHSQVRLDADGNALGGLRPPALSVPLGQYLGSNQGPGFCFLIGGYKPFAAAQLVQRYGNKQTLLEQYGFAVRKSVQARFLLPDDAANLINAMAQDIDASWPDHFSR